MPCICTITLKSSFSTNNKLVMSIQSTPPSVGLDSKNSYSWTDAENSLNPLSHVESGALMLKTR